MTPSNYPLKIYRGDTYRWRYTLWADTAKTQPVDLTGAAVTAEIRDKPGGALLTSLACVVTLPNIIDATLTATASAGLPADGGNWDMQLTYPSGDVSTIISGRVEVTADVTGSALPGAATLMRRVV